jgi:hypothetical protein
VFATEEFPEADKLKLSTVPFKMTDGAVFKFERIRCIVKLSLEHIAWDKGTLRFGVEVPTRATVAEIVAEVQKRADEPLEEARYYAMYQNSKVAFAPWSPSPCQLKPSCILATMIAVKSRNDVLTVQLPTFYPEQWQGIAYRAIPDPTLTLHQTEAGEFTAF